jgi:hypothetical protein
MKLAEIPASARFLDVEGVPVVMLPSSECIAFQKLGDDESRRYPFRAKADAEGDELSREEFAEWLATGVNRYDSPSTRH